MSILPRLALLGALALNWPLAWAEEAPASAAVAASDAAHPSAAAPTEPFLVSADKISGGDTAWMLTSTAVVLMMCVPGPRAVLRRHGAQEKRARHSHAEFRLHLRGHHPVVADRLLLGIHAGQRLHRRHIARALWRPGGGR